MPGQIEAQQVSRLAWKKAQIQAPAMMDD